MRYILKVLLIAIVGLFMNNAEATTQVQQPVLLKTVFDLSPDTPGLMPDTPNKNVCGQQKACVHVVIGNDRTYELVRAINENNSEVGFDSVADDYQVYFPVDGTQPTTEEAVKYSCANFDNRENSPITEWYMKMFGVIDKNGGNSDNDYIKAGWNTDTTATQRIISFDASVDTTPVNDPNIPGAQIGKRDLFEREFRKIASTSVGRVLLYRILIEIRRHNHNNSIGEQEQILANLKRIQNLERNKQRCISIVWANDFSYTQDKSGIYISNRLTKLTCIGHISEKQKIAYIVPVYDTIDISLMHEMLHWWHVLRNIKRTQEERDNRNPENGSYNYHNISNYYFSQYYWNGLNWLSKWNGNEASILPWHFNGEYINFEEMRTILGFSCTDSSKYYLQGDDLSEDLYRVCVGKPLRFGYGHQGFYEDNIVIYRVINTNFTNYIYYCGSTNLIKRRKHARIPGDNSIPEVVNFNYNDKDSIDGLGKFKCLPRELWLPVE